MLATKYKKIFLITLVLLSLVITGILVFSKLENKSQLENRPPEKIVSYSEEDWTKFKRHVLEGKLISERYFNEHYRYSHSEILFWKTPYPERTNSIFFTFNIADTTGATQTARLYTPDDFTTFPFGEGFPDKELDRIIPKKQALAFAAKNKDCAEFVDFNSPNPEASTELKWIGYYDLVDHSGQFEFGYAWEIEGDGGYCIIDVENGFVTSSPYIYAL